MTGAAGRGPIGLIGLGFIGTALGERLLEAGFAVIGYDIEASRTARLAALGMTGVASVSGLVHQCEELIVAVYDTAQVRDVVEGPGGIIEAAAGAGRTVICVSTCEPGAIAEIAARAGAAGVALVEFPLAGNSAQVRVGEATGLVAGDDEAVARVSGVLDALCPRRFAIGRPGDAARAKLAVNLVLQLNRAALAEGLVFAERLGLDLPAFLELLMASPAHSDVMEAKAEKMLRSDFTPQSRIAQTLKDAELMLAEARRLGQRLPLTETNAALLVRAIALVGAGRDSAAVIEAIRESR